MPKNWQTGTLILNILHGFTHVKGSILSISIINRVEFGHTAGILFYLYGREILHKRSVTNKHIV